MAGLPIRTLGDPVLTEVAKDVTDVDGALVRLIDDMFEAMYEAPGIGLAAPQVGVGRRFFVFDHDDDPGVLINPVIKESRGEWEYAEGCLSIPGLYFDIVRPKEILIAAYDIHGNEIEIEADELEARLFQHELDHLDGVLMVKHLNDEQKADSKKALREMRMSNPTTAAIAAPALGLTLP